MKRAGLTGAVEEGDTISIEIITVKILGLDIYSKLF
jgi:hypothetical protein